MKILTKLNYRNFFFFLYSNFYILKLSSAFRRFNAHTYYDSLGIKSLKTHNYKPLCTKKDETDFFSVKLALILLLLQTKQPPRYFSKFGPYSYARMDSSSFYMFMSDTVILT